MKNSGIQVVEKAPVWRLSASGRLRRVALLSMMGAPLIPVSAAQAGTQFGSPQWFDAARAGQSLPAAAPASPTDPRQPTLPNGVSTPDAAAARAERSVRSLQMAIQRIDLEAARQASAAAQPVYRAAAVPDGLAPGGLDPAIKTAAEISNTQGCLSASQCLWVNADLPTETVAQGRVEVEVQQNAEKAILTWESFNVGANTTLHIDQRKGTQSDGKNDWVALNRVKPGVQPSVVQGAIKAEGAVYVINQNGVLFDAGSSVDTHSLLVSSLPLYMTDGSQNLRQSTAAEVEFSNRLYLNSGLKGQGIGTAEGSTLGLPQRSATLLSIVDEDAIALAMPGDIEIAAGARLSVKDEGFGLIAAPNVRNDGRIEGSDSQLAIVAGIGVQLEGSGAAGSRYQVASTGRALNVEGEDITPVFSIENTGSINVLRGGVSLVGTRIVQDGVLQATTSVARQGFIDLQAKDGNSQQDAADLIRYGFVSFGDDSLTAILPDTDKTQTTSSTAADDQFKPLGVTVRASSIVLDSGALIEAPGHRVDLLAVAEDSARVESVVDPDEGITGRIYIAPGAVIDVAGLADVAVPLANVLISVPRLGLNELADSPLQRDGVLFRSGIVFDLRDLGTRADGLDWVGTPLANLAGYVDNIPRGVRELLTNGGGIQLVGNEVFADQGSALNLAGGYLHYGSGMSNATRLITASGSIVRIADADPNVRYVGFAGRTREEHPRWNITDVYLDPLLSAGAATVFEPEDIAGGRAGSLTVFGQSTSLIAAEIDAHAVSGRRQVNAGRPTVGGTLQYGGNFLSQVFPVISTATSGPSYAIVEDLDVTLLQGVNATSDPLERGSDATDLADPGWWTPVSASSIRESGASVLRVLADLPEAGGMGGELRVLEGAEVAVAPGGQLRMLDGVAVRRDAAGVEVRQVSGIDVPLTAADQARVVSISAASIELTGSRVAIDGDLTAPAGRITVTATGRTFIEGSTTFEDEGPVPGDIAVSGDSRLSVRGQFVNDSGLSNDRITGGAYINGGSITLATLQSSFVSDPGTPPTPPDEEDPSDPGDPGTPPTVTGLTGSILLNPGSVLDVISGARITPDGQIQRTSDNLVRGNAGSIALSTFVVNGGPFGRNPTLQTPTELLDGTGRIELGATLDGFGFERGGRLALRAAGILIDGSSGSDAQGYLSVDPRLFTNNGFSDFRLDAVFDATVLPGMDVNISTLNFVATSAGTDEPLPLLGFATGSDLGEAARRGALSVARLDEFHRRPARFELYSGDYLNWVADFVSLTPPDLSEFGVTGTTLVDIGARISADARSTIVLGSHGQVTLFGELRSRGGDVTLTVDTAGGGYLDNPGVIVDPYSSRTKSVLLGAESRIDVSGTTLFDTTSVPEGTSAIPIGDVINGGRVTLSADTGYVIALNCAETGDCAGSSDPSPEAPSLADVAPIGSSFVIPKFGASPGGGSGSDDDEVPPARASLGAFIDLSGASGTVGILAACIRAEDATQLFSDAGQLRIGAASGLFFNGLIAADSGGTGAQGGALTVTPLKPSVALESGYDGARRLVVTAETAAIPDRFLEFIQNGEPIEAQPSGVLNFGVDVLKDSGIASLTLGSDPLLSREIVPIDIVDSLDLKLGREIQINTLLLTARPVFPETGKIKPIEVSLSAPYVAIHGFSDDIGTYNDFEDSVFGLPEVRQPLSQLSVNSRILDIGGQLMIENFKDVALTGSDEIRFLTPPQYASFLTDGTGAYTSLPGVLLVGGNLDLTAGRIYPATNHTQLLVADNHMRRSDLELLIRPTQRDEDGEPLTTLQTIYEPSTAKIRFMRSGSTVGNVKPLSVGGRLIATAVEIEQNGNLYAPGGQIQLGISGDEILEGVNDDLQVFNYDLFPYFRLALPSVILETAYRYKDLAFEDPLTTADTVAYDEPVRTQAALETITRSVKFGAGALTSVSLDGLTVPYGTTVDGLNLVYNGSGDSKAVLRDLRQSPDKRIGAAGVTVTLDEKSVIDFSGGGDLVASEFVAGTGGSRNLLSSSFITFAGGDEQLVSQFDDGRSVYAILPGYSGVAAYDPAFTRRDPDGVGGAQIAASESTRAPMVGRAVFLSGIEGLPEGVYTLLPGAYATLPGAFRLVQDTRAGAQDVISPFTNQKLVDGTLQVSGQFVDQLSGARSAHTTTFLAQPFSTWSRYSELSFTSLNAYFNALEASTNRSLRAPADGGVLALSAVTRLTFDSQLLGAAPSGFSGPEIQLSSPRLEIGDGGTPANGFLSIDADRLNALKPSRLLIGATAGSSEDSIEEFYVGADTVIVSNDQNSSLRAGEIILVARGSELGDGVVVQQGAQLVATGEANGRFAPTISIGGEGTRQRQIVSEDSDDMGLVVDAEEPDAVNLSGNGGLLRVSLSKADTPARFVVSGLDGPEDEIPYGRVTVGAGALLSAAGSISLDATDGVIVSPVARIAGQTFLVNTAAITVADREAVAGGSGDLVLGPALQAQLARIGEVYLQASEAVYFVGDVDLSSRNLLEVVSGQISGDGGIVSLASERVVFSNQQNSFGFGAAGFGLLSVDAERIEFLGDRSATNSVFGFDGFERVEFHASESIVGAGKGQIAFGGTSVLLDTPLYAAAAGADLLLANVADLEARGAGTQPVSTDLEGFGGSLAFSAASIDWNTTARANAGVIRFDSGGDIQLGSDSELDASGAVFTAYDRRVPLAAGEIVMQAGSGEVRIGSGARLDVSAGAAGGDAGRIALGSRQGAVVIEGELAGERAAGARGAQLSVDSRGQIELDRLAEIAQQGGFDGSIRVRSSEGDLRLSEAGTLTADAVRLVADGGAIAIEGRVDATGADGGKIALYGRSGVSVSGSLLANADTAAADGGSVEIGTGAGETTVVDATAGYRAVSAEQAGRIDISESAVIDVSGSGGSLTLRAPVLDDHRVPVTVAGAATIRGAAAPVLEIFARWDTADASTGAQHFSGVIDPSGSIDANPASDNARFVTDTLANYVRTPGWQIDADLGQAAAWRHRAGIELSNTAQGGSINVASNWNLAAGTLDSAGRPVLDFRTATVAPTITLRAAGNIVVTASISDGFFQTINPFNPAGVTTDVDNSLAPVGTATNPLPLATASLLGLNGGKPYDSSSLRIVAGADTGSVDPLAIQAGSTGNVIIGANQTGVSNAVGNEGRLVVTPTMIRTGVGSIDVVAAGDISFTDGAAPGVIYTAGHAGINGVVRPGASLDPVVAGAPPVIDTGIVQPRDAGDLSLVAGRDIVSVASVTDGDGSRTGASGTDLTQYWWPWMQASCTTSVVGCTGPLNASSINFGMFAQGLMSSGGDVRIDAGRDIRSLSVSLPTTWTLNGVPETAIAGGNTLDVYARGDILGGSYFVSSGSGNLRAQGVVGGATSADAPIIAMQDAQIVAEAGQGLNIGGLFNPSYLFTGFDSNAYGAASSARLVTAAGNASFGTTPVLPGRLYGTVGGQTAGLVQDGAFYVLPAHLTIAAANGGLSMARGGELFPSVDGQLELLAQQSIRLLGRSNSGDRLGLIDALASVLPSIDNPLLIGEAPVTGSYIEQGESSNFLLRDPSLLHAHDVEPVRVYSVAGSLLNGYQAVDPVEAAAPQGVPEYVTNGNGLRLVVDKPASLRVGLDIVNLYFSGQNFYASDVTTIEAGRDILDPVLERARFVPVIELGGPGTLAVSAGRNIGPLTSANDLTSEYLVKSSPQFPGIRTIGNSNNLYLDRVGANISLAYGVGPGVNLDEFAQTYINPAVNHDPLSPDDVLGTPDYSTQLVAYVRQHLIDAQSRDGQNRSAQLRTLDPASAWEIFRGLQVAQRQQFAATVFLDILNQVGLDYNGVKRTVVDRNHPNGIEYNADNIRYVGQYGRGYKAIDTLYPAELGYTQNVLDGSRNGALASRTTGTLDMRGSTIQTRFGGNIDILGPGGPVLIGSTSAPPFIAETDNRAAIGPSTQGILALQTGAIRLFSDQSVLLAQSRIFTQQGGDVLIWSSNGDVNAGKGAKTSSEVPPLTFSCDDNLFCVVNTQSQVSGAGIAALQTDVTKPPGSANLIAPVGTVDAGDAGIRVSGGLNVAALQVANADNIQVSGVKIGVPTGVVDTAAVSAANSVAASVTASADQAAGGQKRGVGELELFVEILTPAGDTDCDPNKLNDCRE